MTPTTTVNVVGNLTRDPELAYTSAGVAVARFGVAVNRRYKQGDGTWTDADPHFFNVTAWRELADNVAASLEKGARVVVVGRLNYRPWTDDTGAKRSAVEIEADACGPDLRFATAAVQKVQRQRPDEAPHPATTTNPEPAPVPAYDPAEEPF